MRIITVKKKRYALSSEEINALKVVSSLLKEFIKDEELAEDISIEACASIEDALDIVFTIVNLDGTEFDLC